MEFVESSGLILRYPFPAGLLGILTVLPHTTRVPCVRSRQTGHVGQEARHTYREVGSQGTETGLRSVERLLTDGETRVARLGSGLVNPEEDGAGEADGGHEGVGASIVAHGDAALVLEAVEHVLDAVPLAVEGLVVGDRDLVALG